LAGEDIEIALIDPGKPWQDGMNGPCNDELRDECPGTHWFRNGISAKIPSEDFQSEYHEARSHSSRGLRRPGEAQKSASYQQPTRCRRSSSTCRRNECRQVTSVAEARD